MWPVQSPLRKYSASRLTQISSLSRAVLSLSRGVAHVINVGRDAVDAGGAKDERRNPRTAKSCGPDTPTLVSSSRKATFADDGGKQARSPGSAEETVKTIARGMPGDSGVTVVTTLACSFYFTCEAAGALSARHSLRPLLGGTCMTKLAWMRGEIADLCLLLFEIQIGVSRAALLFPPPLWGRDERSSLSGLGRGVAASGLPVWTPLPNPREGAHRRCRNIYGPMRALVRKPRVNLALTLFSSGGAKVSLLKHFARSQPASSCQAHGARIKRGPR